MLLLVIRAHVPMFYCHIDNRLIFYYCIRLARANLRKIVQPRKLALKTVTRLNQKNVLIKCLFILFWTTVIKVKKILVTKAFYFAATTYLLHLIFDLKIKRNGKYHDIHKDLACIKAVAHTQVPK